MKKFISLIVMLLVFVPTLVLAQDSLPEDEPAHLVLSVEGDVQVSRDGWDISSATSVVEGMNLQATDYLVFSGSSQVVLLCADLTVQPQFSNGVPVCTADPRDPAFVYEDWLEWIPDTPTVAVTAETVIPSDAVDVELEALDESALATLSNLRSVLFSLSNLDADQAAFALASLYARYHLYFDALNVILTLEDLQCTEQDIVRPTGDHPMLESPATFLRLGEWSYLVSDQESSERFFSCALQLTTNTGDVGNAALAAARLGDVTDDPNPFQFYQTAINNYAGLRANDAVSILLERCGSRNCSDPR